MVKELMEWMASAVYLKTSVCILATSYLLTYVPECYLVAVIEGSISVRNTIHFDHAHWLCGADVFGMAISTDNAKT